MRLIACFLLLALLAVACTDDSEQATSPPPAAPAAQPQAVEQAEPDQAEPAGEQAQASGDDKPQTESTANSGDTEPADPASDEQQSDPQPEPASPAPPRLADVRIDFEIAQIGVQGSEILSFARPTDAVARHDGALLVAEQEGRLTWFGGGDRGPQPVLELPVQLGFEEGLLSIAVRTYLRRPLYIYERYYIYAWYTPEGGGRTRLSRFHVQPDSIDELVILEVSQPYPNHNGGAVRFGPDGMLYLGIGDGGAGGDPLGSGQDRSTLLGSIIRIDVSEASPAEPYRIPPDNPFVGDPDARPEIWAYGFRNPWRMDFDPRTGDLWVADVGQNAQEEVAIVRSGENHGWNVYEGDLCFNRNEACGELEAVAPIAVYGRRDGCSVSGGIVHRSGSIPGLDGAFIYGDYCSGKIWAARADGEVVELADTDWRIVGISSGSEGDLLVLAQGQPIHRIIPAGD